MDVLQKTFSDVDTKFDNDPLLFTYLVLIQGLFGGFGLVQIPERLLNLFSSPVARFAVLSMIAYTATRNTRMALMATCVFLGVMHLMRSKEEKKELGGLYF